MRRIIVAALAALLVAGCSPAAGTSPSPPPSVSPSSSPSPSRPASAAVLAARLKAEGLPVRKLIVYTATTDPNHLLGRQGSYTSKVAWQDRRAVRIEAQALSHPSSDRGGIEFGGGIEVFPAAAAARARYAQLRSFTAPIGDGYDYLSGTAILRLSADLTPAQARAYKVAFIAAMQQP